MDSLAITAVSASVSILWNTVGKAFVSDLTTRLNDKAIEGANRIVNERWQEYDWQQAASIYTDSMLRHHSSIRILGKSDPVSLKGIFTDVYILEELSARTRYTIDYLKAKSSVADRFELNRQNQSRIDGTELVQSGKNLFILGKPGAGKTTFLKHIVLQSLQGKPDKLPIFVSLKAWSEWRHQDLISYISAQFSDCGFPEATGFVEHILRNGNAIVLFDGLDEVNQENDQRRKATSRLNNFARDFPLAQCLITCRIAATEYQFDNFRDVEIADFTRDQIHAFVRKWFSDQPAKHVAFIRDLYEEEQESLRELCSIPLLLSMLCLAFDSSMRFPQRRVDLYEDALDALVRKWDASRSIRRDETYRSLSHKRKLQMFARIAAPTFEEGEYFFQRRELERQISDYLLVLPDVHESDSIDGTAVLKSIEAQHGVFVERANGVYSFSHLTFQEYFTAKYIIDNQDTGTIRRLILNYLDDSRWREVIVLAVSLLDDANSFCGQMRIKVDAPLVKENDLMQLMVRANENAESLTLGERQLPGVRLTYSLLALALSGNADDVRYRKLGTLLDAPVAVLDEVVATNHPSWVLENRDYDAIYGLLLDVSKHYCMKLSLDLGMGYAVCAARRLLDDDWTRISDGARSGFLEFLQKIFYLGKLVLPDIQADELACIAIPGERQQRKTRMRFVSSLAKFNWTYCGTGSVRKLGPSQRAELNRYLYLNELMVECLGLATLPNRKLLSDSVFHPQFDKANL